MRPVRFGALPPAAEKLFTKPRLRPKIEPNFEAPAWFFLKEKPQNSYEAGGFVNSLVFLDMEVVKTLSNTFTPNPLDTNA